MLSQGAAKAKSFVVSRQKLPQVKIELLRRWTPQSDIKCDPVMLSKAKHLVL